MRQRHILAVLTTLLLPCVVWADVRVWQDPISKVNYEYDTEHNAAWVKEGANDMTSGSPDATGDITILSKISVDGVDYKVGYINRYAFNKCALTSVVISNTIEVIQAGAFRRCRDLKSVNIPNSVKVIGPEAFDGCISITSLNIPKSVWQIKERAFRYCINLSSITVENGNTVYDSRDNCNAIIKTESNELIAGCKNTIIPYSVQSIGDFAFAYAEFTSIKIPNSVTTIGGYAFESCDGLTSITIPNSVTSIGDHAFLSCASLIEIHSMIKEPFNVQKTLFSSIPANATLYVPAGTKALYEATEGWNKFKNIVEMVNLEPMAGETTVNTENLDGQDLTDNVVDDVYYNVGDGGYDAEDGSVVISQATNMSSITDAEPGTDDMKENFTGMILKVAKGKGTVKVRAKTSGNVQLVVQVGKGVPMLATMNEQGDAMIGYDVKEDSYVYIYAIMGSSMSRTTRASSDSELRIYDIAVSQFDTTPKLPGDTNNDGKLNIVDVTNILNVILGNE